MSLLLAEGHTFARRYPVAVVWSEAKTARRRINQQIATAAVGTQQAIVAALSGPKSFQEFLRTLEDG